MCVYSCLQYKILFIKYFGEWLHTPDPFKNLRIFFQVFSSKGREGGRKERGKEGRGCYVYTQICIWVGVPELQGAHLLRVSLEDSSCGVWYPGHSGHLIITGLCQHLSTDVPCKWLPMSVWCTCKISGPIMLILLSLLYFRGTRKVEVKRCCTEHWGKAVSKFQK